MTADFTGKVATISGAAGGICRVITNRFAAAGAMTAIADIHDEWGEQAEKELSERGFHVFYRRINVRDSTQVDRTVAETPMTTPTCPSLVPSHHRLFQAAVLPDRA